MTKHTPNEIRRENGILWCEIWWQIGPVKRKREIVDAAMGRSPSHWLIDVALLEAMRRVRGELQTHIEDWIPPPQHDEIETTS